MPGSIPPASGPAPGRHARPGVLPVLLVALAIYALAATSARADDRVATAWQQQAGTAPLLQAPRPANPVTICVIDTGVTVTPDLEVTAATLARSAGRSTTSKPRPGQTGHGTRSRTSRPGKVNGWGGAGAFPHARVSSVRIFPKDGRARWQDYTDGR